MNSATTRAELAAAIRQVNVAYGELTPTEQRRVEIVADDLVDAAILDGDRDQAVHEINCWRSAQLEAIREAAR